MPGGCASPARTKNAA